MMILDVEELIEWIKKQEYEHIVYHKDYSSHKECMDHVIDKEVLIQKIKELSVKQCPECYF
jgi:hypothetical protein